MAAGSEAVPSTGTPDSAPMRSIQNRQGGQTLGEISRSAVKMPLVALIVSNASEDIDNAQIARSLGLSPEYVRKACSRPSAQARDGVASPSVLDMKMMAV